ncbi:MAG: PHP domain-containing protein, partial [Chloroflexota bacterium]|nr:PHP domain-containing protein [Chloroflexota bacterium]
REPVKEDLRGIGDRQRGPHLVLLARDATGYRSLCRLVSRANLAGTKSMPRFSQALLAEHTEGLIALSACRHGEIARRLVVGDREGARAVAQLYARLFGTPGSEGIAAAGFVLELQHHLQADDDWLVAGTVALAEELGLPVVVTNDVHYARPEDRELHDVLTAIRHGRTLDELAHLRRPDGESHLKSAAELAALPPSDDPAVASSWSEGMANAGELAASCSVDLGFEQYRFPGFAVPNGETPFSYLVELCQAGVRRRYHPLTPPVVKQLAHELGVIEKTGLAEFFLICWDLMRFAKERGIPAQGRGSAADSIVAYALGITRVDPIRHNLLFERFINEGRTAYPDVDIDFSSERREEIIQYVYGRYGEEHTGMVCNLVTYRARSAVREVGYALGFPRPLVDRVAKALETYDSVMVRRDLEADGGFADFFRRPGEDEATEARAAATAGARGLTDGMGQLNHVRRGGAETGPEDSAAAVSAASSAPYRTHRSSEHDERAEAPANPSGTPTLSRPAAWRIDGSDTGRDNGPDEGGEQRLGASLPHAASMGAIRERPTATQRPHSPGPSASGMWEEAPESPPSVRPGGRADDEGGPGDTPASVAWLRAGRGTGYRHESAPGTIDGRTIDPESGVLLPAPRRTDKLGRPNQWDPPAPRAGSSVARVEPEPPPQTRGGSTV